MRILLLEDEVALGKGISLKLEREGYEITWAETVEQSMALLDTPFDLVDKICFLTEAMLKVS